MSETDCVAVLKQVELYLDGELEAASFTEIEVHLSGCGSCLKRMEFRNALREIIRSKCRSAPVPDDLMARIRSSLDRPPS